MVSTALGNPSYDVKAKVFIIQLGNLLNLSSFDAENFAQLGC